MASLKGNDLLLHFSTFCLRCVQITQTEVQQGQQQFNQFTDGQVRVPPNVFLKTTKSNPSKKTSEDGEDLYTGRLSLRIAAVVSDPAGDDAGRTGADPAHVHPVHQPDGRGAGHAGQHRLRNPCQEPLLSKYKETRRHQPTWHRRTTRTSNRSSMPWFQAPHKQRGDPNSFKTLIF